MARDLEEIYARGCWWFPRRAAYYLSAVWVGSQVGAFAILAGSLAGGMKFEPVMAIVIALSPLLLVNGFVCPNLIVLSVALVIVTRCDSLSYRAWAIFAGIESLAAFVGWIPELRAGVALIVAWVSWVILVAMMGTAVWFLYQWQFNRWAAELSMLKAENAARRATRPNDAEPEVPLDLD